MPMMQTPTGAGVPPDISAVEEQLRRLGFASNPAGMMSMTPGPALQGTPDPQSAVAAILAAQNAEFQKVAAGAQAPPPPPPAPIDTGGVVPETNATQVDGGKESTNLNPLWALPVAAALAAMARLAGGKGLARTAKGAKGPSSAAAAANAARGKVGMRPGTVKQGPPKPTRMGPNQPANYPRPMQGPQQPLELTDVVAPPPAAALPPPTLTQTEAPPAVSQALVERAKGNMRGPVSDRMPTPPTPRPVLPTYTAPLDEAADIQGSELAKAIRIAGEVARGRAKSATKTERLNKKRPPAPTQYTPDRRVPQEEGERKSFNEVVKAIREAKNPPQIVKDLRPWLKEMKKDIGQPVLPPKKRGRNPKPKYKEVPETAKALAKRKVDSALKTKRKPRSKKDK